MSEPGPIDQIVAAVLPNYPDATFQIVPAQPGWFSVFQDRDSGELFIGEQVLAWAFSLSLIRGELSVMTLPLHSSGWQAEPNHWGTLRPDGQVEEVLGSTFENFDAANKEATSKFVKRSAKP